MRLRHRFQPQRRWILFLARPQPELITASAYPNPACVAGFTYLKRYCVGHGFCVRSSSVVSSGGSRTKPERYAAIAEVLWRYRTSDSRRANSFLTTA
jgi:hypothetical protein